MVNRVNLDDAEVQRLALIEEAAAVEPRAGRRAGKGRGTLWMADDFDAPLPPEMLDGFEGLPKT